MPHILYFISLVSFTSLASEVNISLTEPASTIVIARDTGIVSHAPLSHGDYVVNNNLIVSIKNDTRTVDIMTTHNGIIKAYGKDIIQGQHIDSGDFVAEIIHSDVVGMLSIQNDSASINSLTDGKIYCCLKVENMSLEIKINRHRNHNGMTTFFFSVVTDELTLLRMLSQQHKTENDMSFTPQLHH